MLIVDGEKKRNDNDIRDEFEFERMREEKTIMGGEIKSYVTALNAWLILEVELHNNPWRWSEEGDEYKAMKVHHIRSIPNHTSKTHRLQASRPVRDDQG